MSRPRYPGMHELVVVETVEEVYEALVARHATSKFYQAVASMFTNYDGLR